MSNCHVLRCQNPGAVVINNDRDYDPVESYVCQPHKNRIDAGEAWGFDTGRVLMGDDMPPELSGWTVRDGDGTRGVSLTLTTERDGKTQSFDVFLRPESIDQLSMIFATRGTK